MRGQGGFFDVEERLKELSAPGGEALGPRLRGDTDKASIQPAGQPFGDLELPLDGCQQQDAGIRSRLPSKPTCTGLPAIAGKPGRITIPSSMAGANSVGFG